MIKNLNLEDVIKDSKIIESKERKERYGEINTPFSLIERMFNIIPSEDFRNPLLKWLDPGTGSGNFSIYLYFKLLESLKEKIIDIEERKNHIIKNMIYMAEIQSENIKRLKYLFGDSSNIFEDDFLSFSLSSKFDYIIGNPPFNSNGIKKVPTNAVKEKAKDGNTSWPLFIKRGIILLKEETGKMCVFIPSIWLKPDKEKMYYILTQYQIDNLNCYSNTETNKIFKGNAQTPCCFFLLTKRESNKIISIFDKEEDRYLNYKLKPDIPIPVDCQRQIILLSNFINKTNMHIDVIKTNLVPKHTFLSRTENEEYKYPNISTCILEQDINKKKIPKLIINYSDKPLAFSGQPKLVLAHKMYGLPYLDKDGKYGISNRDNYVIIKEKIEDLIILQRFLSLPIIQKLYKSTQYRMKYLEKYVFELIPDITKIPDFPKEITDETISQYFGISLSYLIKEGGD